MPDTAQDDLLQRLLARGFSLIGERLMHPNGRSSCWIGCGWCFSGYGSFSGDDDCNEHNCSLNWCYICAVVGEAYENGQTY